MTKIEWKLFQYIARGELKLGELMKAAKAAGQIGRCYQFHKEKSNVDGDDITKTTLAEAGISRDLSSRAQNLANLPKQEFEKRLAAQDTAKTRSLAKILHDEEKASGESKPHHTAPSVPRAVDSDHALMQQQLTRTQLELKKARAILGS